MGPGGYPSEPYPRQAIVSSAELGVVAGTWSADYFVNRLPGETLTAFKVRQEIADLERRATDHETAAARLRAKIDTLKEGTNAEQ
jgi:hypothetical protein